MLLSSFLQSAKSFDRWSQKISNTARLISYDNYDQKQAAVDAMILQTSCPKLHEQALQENTTYASLMKLGTANEQSAKGAVLLNKLVGIHPWSFILKQKNKYGIYNLKIRGSKQK